MKKFIIDRIESDFAVCEDELGNLFEIPLDCLPSDVREQQWISYNLGVYSALDGMTDEKKFANTQLYKSLKFEATGENDD